MTVKLGMFTMPFHHPDRDYATILEEDQEAIVLADRLGFTEAFVGEHFSSWSERITSPLIFFATLIPRTTQIRFGTGVINLPQLHPATVAAHAAMFDQLCKGRFIMGIGPGGLVSDLEMFDVGQAELRPQMVHRVHRDRAQAVGPGPALRDRRPLLEDLAEERHLARVQGRLPCRGPTRSRTRPSRSRCSRPTPTARSPRVSAAGSRSPASSSTAATCAGTGRSTSRAASAAGRRPDPDIWRVSRSILVTESDAQAEEYLADPDNGLSFYYHFFHHSFSKGRKALFMLKPDLDVPDEDVTMDMIKRALVIAGSPRRVVEQLVALREETGHFGTLLMGGHDWDQPALWRRSMELLATQVMPQFAKHATHP